MMKTNLVIVVIIMLAIAACKHEANMPVPQANGSSGNGGGNNGGGNNSADTALCFERDILPIFISNCAKAGCHDAASRRDGYQFTDYNSIVSKDFQAGNADNTELYEKITEDKADKIMPPPPNSPLTTEQKALIRRWINEGAQNTTGCGTLCDTNNFAFAADIKPIFEKNCQGCHSGAAAPRGIMLDSHSGIAASANGGRLLGAIKHQTGFVAMPQGGNKLSDCEIRQVEKWVSAGAPNN